MWYVHCGKKNKTVKQEVIILADGITMKEIHET